MRALALVIALVVACERAEPAECPEGASMVVRPPRIDDSRSCELADGTRHGLWISGDLDGAYVRGSYELGKKHGVWRRYLHGRLSSETHYQHGEKQGRLAIFDQDGTVIVDCQMHTGVFHGHCDLAREAGLYFEGFRVGTWKAFDLKRGVSEVKHYDTGVLRSVDGRSLPPPPAAISTGTTTIDRKACERDSRSLLHARCRELFEAHQRCALEARPEECRDHALQQP